MASQCVAQYWLRDRSGLTRYTDAGRRGDPPRGRLASTLAAAQAEREKAWGGEPTRLNRARELPSPGEWSADRSGSLVPYSSAGTLHPCHAWSMQQRPNPPRSELGLARRAERAQQNA